MKDKNYTTQAEEKEQLNMGYKCYTYFGSRVEIGGIKHPVVAAIPFGIISCQLPTAEQSLLNLIKEK